MKSITRWVCSPMKQRDELFSNAEHEAVPTRRFASSGRAGRPFCGVAGCALAAAAHRRSKMQRKRREAELEEEARAAWP